MDVIPKLASDGELIETTNLIEGKEKQHLANAPLAGFARLVLGICTPNQIA